MSSEQPAILFYTLYAFGKNLGHRAGQIRRSVHHQIGELSGCRTQLSVLLASGSHTSPSVPYRTSKRRAGLWESLLIIRKAKDCRRCSRRDEPTAKLRGVPLVWQRFFRGTALPHAVLPGQASAWRTSFDAAVFVLFSPWRSRIETRPPTMTSKAL